MMLSPASKVMSHWSCATHGKVQFATLDEAKEFAKNIPYDPESWGSYDVGSIEITLDGTYWVVIP